MNVTLDGIKLYANSFAGSRSNSRDVQKTEACRASSRRAADRRVHVARGGAGPILGQYLWPVTASRGASWPLPRVRTALLPIVWSKLRRVRFPFSALDFVAVA